MLFLTMLFGIVMILFAFALMKDRGQHTEHARRNRANQSAENMKPAEPRGRAIQLH